MTFGYWLFALMILPLIGGIVCWIKFHTIDLKELACGVGVSILTISGILSIGTCSVQHDTQTLSGRVTSAVYIPEWKARWTETETYTVTDSKGKSSTKTRTVTKNKTYPEEWYANTTLGKVSITKTFYQQISNKHGSFKELGDRYRYYSGDLYDYISNVRDDPAYCDYPMTSTRSWRNPLKGARGLHNLPEISEKSALSMGLPAYPDNDTFGSSRLVGNIPINIWNWDKLNSFVGPQKHVNLIAVNLPGGLEQAKQLQAYWQNGKKNDLVICYGGSSEKPEWCYVFGWSKSELVKLNIQTIFLNNIVNDDIVKPIQEEVLKNFEPHDWATYKDSPLLIPSGLVIGAFIFTLLNQIGLYILFHKN